MKNLGPIGKKDSTFLLIRKVEKNVSCDFCLLWFIALLKNYEIQLEMKPTWWCNL